MQKDDLTPLLQDITACNAIVMGTPVYWYLVTAQFKMPVDRLDSFMELKEDPRTGQPTMASTFPAGKQIIIVISRGDPEPPSMFPQFYDHLNEWLNLTPFSLGAGKYEFFPISTERTPTDKPPATTMRCWKRPRPPVPGFFIDSANKQVAEGDGRRRGSLNRPGSDM